MPDKRTHRGAHPQDEKLFDTPAVDRLRTAVSDFSLLLTRGYAEKSALKLVGDRFALTERQRLAVMRSACSDQQLACRCDRRIEIENLAGSQIVIDGYNLLITVEAAMSGGLILKGRDGCFRDLASIHGTYRKVTETIPAVRLIGQFLDQIGVAHAKWLLDSPVSNSGRLKTLIAELADENKWNWEIDLLISPDFELARTDLTVATSDSAVLDRCKSWVNLALAIIEDKLPKAHLIDLSP
ncbi:MAG TPA: DUF434 domain-containing protein [Sedimentisphaerales bacterium]|nr:DUF434 domain-containing protein [Sedimentisphaerales bacterium]